MPRTFKLTEEDLAIGVANTKLAIISGVSIGKQLPAKLSEMRSEALFRALSYTENELEISSALEGFRQIYRALECGPEVVPAAESFVRSIQKAREIHQINTAVDAYNTVVVESLMGIGAHDLDRIEGDVTFRPSSGEDLFWRLMGKKPTPVRKGEFIYCDEEKVLARLAFRDCDEAKIELHTQNILLVIEAHALVSLEFVTESIELACRRIVEFCGGAYTVFSPEF